jgi:hypothetical protein
MRFAILIELFSLSPHKFNGNFVAAIGHVPRGVVTHKKEFATGF